MVGDSFAYAKDAIIGKWMQWLLLVIATIILCIPLLGYTLKILRGEKPAPEVTGWGTLFIDGIKYIIVAFVWAIPCLIVLVLALGSFIAAIASGDTSAAMVFIGGAILGLLVFLVVAIITSLLATIGIVRFARTGSMGEAFNIGNNNPVTLMQFIEAIEKAVGRPAAKRFLPLQDGDVPATFADVSELSDWTGFRPETPVADGIQRFVDWYRGYFAC